MKKLSVIESELTKQVFEDLKNIEVFCFEPKTYM